MKIYIELLIPAIIIFIILCWRVWLAWTRKRLLKKYNPDNDKARKGEQARLGSGGVAEPVISSADLGESKERELLQVPTIDTARPDKLEPRKTSKSTRGIFAKLRRRRN